ALCWTILKRDISLRLTPQNKISFAGLTLAAAIIRVLPYVGLARIRTPVALGLAMMAGSWSVYVIWGTVGGIRGLLARDNAGSTISGITRIAASLTFQTNVL